MIIYPRVHHAPRPHRRAAGCLFVSITAKIYRGIRLYISNSHYILNYQMFIVVHQTYNQCRVQNSTKAWTHATPLWARYGVIFVSFAEKLRVMKRVDRINIIQRYTLNYQMFNDSTESDWRKTASDFELTYCTTNLALWGELWGANGEFSAGLNANQNNSLQQNAPYIFMKQRPGCKIYRYIILIAKHLLFYIFDIHTACFIQWTNSKNYLNSGHIAAWLISLL